MGFNEKPPDVKKAIQKRDTEALRQMQKRSVESAKINRAERKENAERTLIEARLHEAQLQNDSEATTHYDELLRQMRGDK